MREEAAIKSEAFKLDMLVLIFFRGTAFLFLLMSIQYWALMIGFNDPAIRFDTMPNHWKIAGTVLCVLKPITALGLWGMYRWGIAIWFITISVEIFMHVLMPQEFGEKPVLMFFHGITACTYIVYKVTERFEKRRQQSSISEN